MPSSVLAGTIPTEWGYRGVDYTALQKLGNMCVRMYMRTVCLEVHYKSLGLVSLKRPAWCCCRNLNDTELCGDIPAQLANNVSAPLLYISLHD